MSDPRFYHGPVEVDEDGTVLMPPVPEIRPGETAHAVWDGVSPEATWVVEASPGLRAWFLRLRFRLFGPYGEPKLKVGP